MKLLFPAIASLFLLCGCTATWSGVKQDSSDAWQWTKQKVNEGADYVREKTE